MVERPIQSEDGGSNPTPSLHFIEISEQKAAGMVIEHHYKHRRCPILRAWGIEKDGEILGVLTIGLPVTFSARCDVVGESKAQKALRTARQHNVYELNRLWVSDTLPRTTESRFIGWCLREIKKIHPHIILISYADTEQGHIGYVYQATNWLYVGYSIAFDDIALVGGKDYRSAAEKIRGGVIFKCETHGYFEGPLPPKSKSGSRDLPAVPQFLPCPRCSLNARKLNKRAWSFIRDADGILRPRGRAEKWIHYEQDRTPHQMELRPRTKKHRYVWFANPQDKAFLALAVLPYPKKEIP